MEKLGLQCGEPNMDEWRAMVDKIKHYEHELTVAIVGKYVALHDAYLSIVESLRHAGFDQGIKVDIRWVDSETVTKENVGEILKGVAGIIVPGGFGDRGIEGKINAIQYVRENNIPFLGICLGMQLAVVEYARNVLECRGQQRRIRRYGVSRHRSAAGAKRSGRNGRNHAVGALPLQVKGGEQVLRALRRVSHL